MNLRGDRRFAIALAMTGVVFAIAGCGGGGGGAGPGSTDPLTAGWASFESRDYAAARTSFESALAADPGNSDALDGLGWALARLDSVDAALAQFAACVTAAPNNTAALAGRASAALAAAASPADPNLDFAIASADAALALEPNFQFNHDASVDWRDLRLIIAQASFAKADYSRAATEVTALGGTPPTPGATDFVQQLLAEIRRLKSVIG